MDAADGSPTARALRAAVRIPTVSSPDSRAVDLDALRELRDVLARHFPALWAEAGFELVSDSGGLLGFVAGESSGEPVVLMGHQDVVPAEDPAQWRHPPFEGVVADGFVHGRGTLDCKGTVIAICAAVERILASGRRPSRDAWLSFGANEEVSGDAAQAAVDALVARGVEPWFVLDEGGAIVPDALPGLTSPLALIGVCEKGTTDVELVATSPDAGHASTPPRMGATARLARAILRLERRRAPVSIPEPSLAMFEAAAPHARGVFGWVYRNVRRLAWPFARVLARLGPETEAVVRTTVAVTRLTGSSGRNVIANRATASANLRVAVGETAAQAIARLRRTIADGAVDVQVVDSNDPTPVAPLDHAGFRLLTAVTSSVLPGVVVAPYVMLGASDARFFQRRWPAVYRFTPIRMDAALRATIHGVDERVAVADLEDAVSWYEALLTAKDPT